jgi:multiple sugar transport system substrate-binding protein
MRRVASAAAVLVATLATSACFGGGGNDSGKSAAGNEPGTGQPVTITFWEGFSDPEYGEMKKVIALFERTHPAIHVKTVKGVSDDKILAAIRGGNAPDIAQSFKSDDTGAYCASGAFIDLAPYMKQDGVSMSIFPPTPRYYSQFDGTQCTLPMLADAYGIYYNKELLRKAGLKGPPKTISELTAYAKRLTQRNSDGSLKVVGFDPFTVFYEAAPEHLAPMFGAKYLNADDKSVIAEDPAWKKLLNWQRGLIDFYGYDNLVRFQAGAGDEFSASNAFERGKLAMNLDGEWRVRFIQREHPELQYGTAPLPVDDGKRELYGSGYINGSLLGIPKNAEHKDEAWVLLRWLATNDRALAMMANGIGNVPTTTSSLKSPLLKLDPRFKVFLDIFAHPKSSTTPITVVGSAYLDQVQSFFTKWQAGRTDDLAGGLRNLDEQIDAQIENATGGQTP